MKKNYAIAVLNNLNYINERIHALPYYRSLTEKFPEWCDELNIAIKSLESCVKDHLGKMWVDDVEDFRDLATRKKLANAGRKCMQKDMEAVEQFEKILKKEGV